MLIGQLGQIFFDFVVDVELSLPDEIRLHQRGFVSKMTIRSSRELVILFRNESEFLQQTTKKILQKKTDFKASKKGENKLFSNAIISKQKLINMWEQATTSKFMMMKEKHKIWAQLLGFWQNKHYKSVEFICFYQRW